MKRISIVSITYNEEGNVAQLYETVTAVMEKLPYYEYEFIIADNCSQDKTVDLLQERALKDKRLKLILNANNFGATRSQFNALLSASGDAAIVIPADLQVPPAIFPDLIKEWESGFEVVCATYTKAEGNWFIKHGRKLYYNLMERFADATHIPNFTGPGLYDRKFLDALKKYREPDPYLRGLVSEIGFRQTSYNYAKEPRKSGRSNYRFWQLYDVALSGMVNYSKMPLRLTTFFGYIIALLCIICAFTYLVAKLIWWDSFSFGMAPLVIGMFFIGAVQLVSIGILGEYVIATLVQAKDKPHVIERKRINFTETEE